MLQGLDLSGLVGLDLGCGIGGYDFLLVGNHNVRKVIGVDIDAASLYQARKKAAKKSFGNAVEFLRVEPGPLPFDDDTFDFAFSKDSIVDIPDKSAVARELFRVVCPGGFVVMSDWFRSEEPYTEEMRTWATTGDETYEMDTLKSAARYLTEAGFNDVELDDRNDWFREYARDEYERLKGPLFEVYVDKFGAAQAKSSVENARIRLLLAEQGQLRPGHIRAFKP